MAIQHTPDATQEESPRHTPPQIDSPPDLPPAPAGKARNLIAIVLLILAAAGAVTFLMRRNEADALARETEADSVPTVAVVQPADGHHFPAVFVDVVPDELGHRPGFERRLVRPQVREVPNHDADEFALTVPETGE